LRLTATGVLIGCLARSEGIALAPLLRGSADTDGEELVEAVEQALGMKRRDGEFVQPRAMVGIGG
jgi:molybdenum cofactor biosynthesis enzyme MoaA